ncbi:hypothetical protein C3747_13g153 [Trypanosoma cruzi]|uniref:Uncharacterized protein n=1 Tax=Trypanosoma cruzi TaxID=5693 RepID=A0A2V2XCQ9_TRYCR|nr:hypothetical protein C3747_13g153 [Trypanosoma cruzi]
MRARRLAVAGWFVHLVEWPDASLSRVSLFWQNNGKNHGKKLLRSQPGFLPFRSFSLHINAASDDTWVSIVVHFPKYRTVFWGRSNGSTCFANCEISCGSKLCVSTIGAACRNTPRFMECAVTFQGARARSTWAVVRFVSLPLFQSVIQSFIMSNASCPRIPTNREAQWGSALAVFGATGQYKTKAPSASSVKLLGVKAAISDQRLAVIHASRKTTRSFQSVRLRIT